MQYGLKWANNSKLSIEWLAKLYIIPYVVISVTR
jgi:hypothetical protein